MSLLLYRIGGWAARHRFTVVLSWILLLILVVGGAGALGQRFNTSFNIPGTSAQVALDTLEQRFPAGASNASVKVIFIGPAGGKISSNETAINAAVSDLSKVKGVASVQSPFDSTVDKPGLAISNDGSMAYATVTFDAPGTQITMSQYADVRAAAEKGVADSKVTLAYSGMPDPPTPGDATELVGMLISFAVLAITFGSLLTAGMPLLTAIIGVALTAGLITVGSNIFSLSATTPVLAEMLGLAVGIDYALFIVSRHRSQLAKGMDVRESIAVATATAGSAVLFAGTTVVIALLGLLVVGIPFVSAMGLGAAASVIMAMCVAVTLLPGILSIAGKRLIPKPKSRAYKREAASTPNTVGARWVRLVTAKPLVTLVIAVAGLGALALPVTHMRLALPDAGADPAGSITRTGYDTLAKGWGPGTNGPLIAIADLSHTDITQIATNLTAFSDAFTSVPGVASVSPAVPNQALDAALVSITPTTSPDSVATEDLVNTLRLQSAAFAKKNGFSYQITGQTALNIDISTVLSGAILPFAIVVVGLSLFLLLIVFRSIAVPLSATGGFLLSVGAAFGVSTAIFQEGHFAQFFGLAKPGPIISFMPIMVMAVLFGLAMDYQVFLVSRIREHFISSTDAKGSVTSGFVAAARVVMAAALIMMSVFFSFVPGSGAAIQPIALALALGVAFDALVVRMTIIPAFMALLGDKAWSLPRSWKKLPDVDIEGVQVEGLREAHEWQEKLTPGLALAIESDVLAPSRVEAVPGDLVVISTSEDADVRELLGALAGRAIIAGNLSVLGSALPYESARVRRKAALVLPGSPVLPGTVGEQLRKQGQLDHVSPRQRVDDLLTGLAPKLGRASGVSLAGVGPTTLMSELTTDQVWILDAAVSVAGAPELLVIDARSASHPEGLLAAITKELPASTTVVAAVREPAKIAGRSTIQATLVAAQVVTA
jgi:RND superfamily putative drug exporter